LIAAALVLTDSPERGKGSNSLVIGIAGFAVVFVSSFLLMIPSQIIFEWCRAAGHAASGFERNAAFLPVFAGRAVSWCVFSIGIVSVLIVHRGPGIPAALVAGAIVSGTISGLIFDPIQIVFSGHGSAMPWAGRVVCFVVCGSLIGFIYGMAQCLSRKGLLLVSSGGSAGKKLVLDSKPCLIGPSSDCCTVSQDGDITGSLALVQKTGFGFKLYALDDNTECSVNNRKVRHANLRHGDSITIGSVNLLFSGGK